MKTVENKGKISEYRNKYFGNNVGKEGKKYWKEF